MVATKNRILSYLRSHDISGLVDQIRHSDYDRPYALLKQHEYINIGVYLSPRNKVWLYVYLSDCASEISKSIWEHFSPPEILGMTPEFCKVEVDKKRVNACRFIREVDWRVLTDTDLEWLRKDFVAMENELKRIGLFR